MDNLIAQLRSFAAPDVFNPWRECDPMDIGSDGAADRVVRLRSHFDCDARLMLVGEAPGYQGCHFSGVAFTNEKLITDGVIPRVSSVFRFTTRERPWCEPSATIVWSTLRALGLAEHTVLWNAFAWHPHRAGERYSNRTPTGAEVESGAEVLRSVITRFPNAKIVPVGRVSAKTLNRLGVPVLDPVRHPSMGGANEFREGLRKLFPSSAH